MKVYSRLRIVVALLIGLAVAVSTSGCGLNVPNITRNPTPGATYESGTGQHGPTPTTNTTAPLVSELARLQTAFAAGKTQVSWDTTTFPPGSDVVLLTHGIIPGAEVTYRIQTTVNGPLKTVTVPAFQLVDWKYRSNPAPPVIISDGPAMIPLMASVYENFNGQQMSLTQAEQQINNGRPVGIRSVTAQIIYIQDFVGGKNSDGTLQYIPVKSVSLMFASAAFVPAPANLG